MDAGRVVLHAPLEDLREQVRQVQLPGDAEPPLSDNGLTVIHRCRRGDAQLLWVRGEDNVQEQAERRFGDAALIRPVTLESLYLAVVEKEGV